MARQLRTCCSAAVATVATITLGVLPEVFSCSCVRQRGPEECGEGSIGVLIDVEAGTDCNEYSSFSGETFLDPVKFWDVTVREVIKYESEGGLSISPGDTITVITTADSCQLFLTAGAQYILYGEPDKLREIPPSDATQTRRRMLDLDTAVSSSGGGGTTDPGSESCCAAGEACCGSECVDVEQLAARLCPTNSNCCGGSGGDGGPSPDVPATPIPDDDYNACCESTEYCCGASCAPRDEDPPRSCPPPWGSMGCCPGGTPPGLDDPPTPPPDCICPAVIAPVCNPDTLKGYSNDCAAACAGEDPGDLTEGNCDEVSPPPGCVCPEIYAPVCNRDTLAEYENDCVAACNGEQPGDLDEGACDEVDPLDPNGGGGGGGGGGGESAPDCATTLQQRNGEPRAHIVFSGCDSWVLQQDPTADDVAAAKVACGGPAAVAPESGGTAPAPAGATGTPVDTTAGAIAPSAAPSAAAASSATVPDGSAAGGSGGVSTTSSAAGGPVSESAGSDEAGSGGSGDDGAGDGETSSTRDVSGEEPDSDVITSEPSVAFNHLSSFTAAWVGLGGTMGVLVAGGAW